MITTPTELPFAIQSSACRKLGKADTLGKFELWQAARGFKVLCSYAANSTPLSRLFSSMVLLGILGLLQTASAQNNCRRQSASHEGDTATEPSGIVTRTLTVSKVEC